MNHNYDALILIVMYHHLPVVPLVEVVPSHGEAVVVVVAVVVEVEVVMEVEVAVAVEVVETTGAGLMDRPTAPRTASTGRQIPTVGPVGMIVQLTMIVTHVRIKQQVIKMEQPVLIQWEVPLKINNSQNGNDAVGSYKQIILKRKRLTQQQKE